MELQVQKSTQFKINELTVVTKAGQIDISSICDEINIYDTMLLPVITGKLLITDSVGLSGKLIFDGSEALLIDISKDRNSDIGNYKKAFRIYKQSGKENIGLNTQRYILHFVSDELIYSDQQRVNQVYETTYNKIVESILIDYLKVPQSQLTGVFESTMGVRRATIPNLRPLSAIEWCTKRAVDLNNSPNFMFFQNAVGYNFASLSTLLTQEEILNIKFEPKNVNINNAITELSSARSLEVVSQVNAIDKVRSGVDSGKFTGFDPVTGVIGTNKISYADHFSSMKHGNENPATSVISNREKLTNMEMYDSKKTVSVFGAAKKLSNYIKNNDPQSLSKEDDIENYKFQRAAILYNLMNKRVRLTMPGNFQLSSGFNVNLIAPNFSIKEKGDDNEDSTLSGKYIIVATRHVIGYDKHETLIEIATTSTANEFVPASSYEQTKEILEY